ncbi:hypothetical protein G6F68_010496 [Rhizopus microsporus]|nr:hypothetical protein G6F69_009494 [Rhizopus microsporus]KAG1224761.1 hypothetical protein G6F67_009447 [Rhizopus microsporus]KAG1255182.1 hypothetical protein G6F68_010496 [Rhizopus microsporus]
MKRIPDSIKMEIIAKISTNMTQREIAKELKVSDGYVAKVAKEVNHTSVNSAGRNPILSDITKRHSILKFKMGGYATATAASRAIVPTVAHKTVPMFATFTLIGLLTTTTMIFMGLVIPRSKAKTIGYQTNI